MNEQLVDCYSELLNRPGWNWSWFATLTYKDEVKPESALKDFRRWLFWVNGQRFGVRISKTEFSRVRGRGRVPWALATERQKRGVLHFHVLVGDVRGLNRFEAMKEWEKCGSPVPVGEGLQPRTGFARIYDYDPALGGTRYVSKYVVKGGEVEIGCDAKTASSLVSKADAAEAFLVKAFHRHGVAGKEKQQRKKQREQQEWTRQQAGLEQKWREQLDRHR